MALVSAKELVKDAQKKHYALGHFNINGFDWITTYLKVAQKTQTPMVIATSDRIIDDLGGFEYIRHIVNFLMEELQITVPIVLHLDHGLSKEHAFQAIDAGYTSVMFDGSKLPIDENVALTKEVVDYAHSKGVSVEAEVGAVGGNENGLVSGIKYASLEDALKMKETGVDVLAAALGSVHGDYTGTPDLNFERMKEIAEQTGLPLVLHGASGIPSEQIQTAIQMGTAKININTEVNYAWLNAVRDKITAKDVGHEPIPVLAAGKQGIEDLVIAKLKEFHVLGKLKEEGK